jgi:hypothetical protein
MSDTLLPPAPSPSQLRAFLEQKVIADLLGPAGGHDEEVVERAVRDRYVVGVLAPRRRKDKPPAEIVIAATPKPASADDEDEFPPVLNDELAEEGSDWPEDGPATCPSPCPSPLSPRPSA